MPDPNSPNGCFQRHGYMVERTLRKSGVGKLTNKEHTDMASENKETALVLRTCNADLTSYDDFQWPDQVGVEVVAPDWRADDGCGHGLHGWLFGQGDSSASSSIGNKDAKWLVVEVTINEMIELGGKVKFPSCVIRHIGDKTTATNYLIAKEPRCAGLAVIGSTLTGGDGCTLTGGDYSTLTGGDGCTLTGGDGSTLTGGDGSTLTGGDGCTLTGGYYSTLTGGYGSTLTGGNYSTLTGGDGCTLTGGDGSTLTGGDGCTLTGGYYSTLTGGYGSTLTGGNYSTLTGGDGCTLTGGYGSTLTIKRWDKKSGRYRTHIAYVGESGIEPNKPYVLDENNKFVLSGGEE